MSLLSLLVLLIILAIALWIARAVLTAMGAPAWFFQIALGVALIILVVLVAQALGVATPNLR